MDALLKFLQDNPVWQFVISTIIALLTAVVTIIVSIWIYQRGKERRRIVYKILNDIPSSFLVKVAYEQHGNVSPSRSISLRGHKIALEIWNAGNTSVLPEDYIMPIILSFGKMATILEAHIVRTSPENVENAVLLEYDTEKVILDKPLLNSKESITLMIWLSGSSNKLNITSRIKGINSILEYRQSNIFRYIFVSLFAIFLLIMIYIEGLIIGRVIEYIKFLPILYLVIIFNIIFPSVWYVYYFRYTYSAIFHGFQIKLFKVKYLAISISLMLILFFLMFFSYNFFLILIGLSNKSFKFLLITVPISVIIGSLYDEFNKINRKWMQIVIKLTIFLIFSSILYIIIIKIGLF